MGLWRCLILLVAALLIGLSSSSAQEPVRPAGSTGSTDNQDRLRNHSVGKKMKVIIGSRTFSATLDENPAATKFRAMLPLTLDMSELNGNEKLFRMSTSLPTDSANPGTIQNGDLMLWGANTLVMFYKTFPTVYSYTRLGRIDNPAGLAAAVGSESVTVKFELE